MDIKKITIGIRFQKRMMRLGSLSGVVMDRVVEVMGEQDGTDALSRFERSSDGLRAKLMDAGDTKQLLLDPTQIIFVHDNYEIGNPVDLIRFQQEFAKIFAVTNEILRVSDARRIGVVAEYRQKQKAPSEFLFSALTKLSKEGALAKFILQFERRFAPTTKVGSLDASTDDFINVIEAFYDSETDGEHAESGCFNLTLDVQRYYNPILRADFIRAADAVLGEFQKRQRDFLGRLKALGLADE